VGLTVVDLGLHITMYFDDIVYKNSTEIATNSVLYVKIFV